jgi:hypothetical protein
MKRLAVLVWFLWWMRLLPPDREFWNFVWCKFVFETISGYGTGELDHWPEAWEYGPPRPGSRGRRWHDERYAASHSRYRRERDSAG